MKPRLYIALSLGFILNIANTAPVNSLPLNERVYRIFLFVNGDWYRQTYSVDVDMDGSNDVSFYISSSPGSTIRLATANDVYVSCVNIPDSDSEGNPITFAAFTTFTEGSVLDSDLFYPPDATYDPWWTWETGDLPFHGFDIGGGIPSRDSYLGVKLIKGSEEHYGWIRLIFPVTYEYLDETGYVKIKESSYETTPSSSIVAGAGRVEDLRNHSSLLELGELNSLILEISEVSHRLCLLQVSTDLLTWDTIHVEYSTESNLTKALPKEDSSKFYRWQVTENLEEIN